MKTNFKKTLAVLMVVLMLLSSVGVTCLAAYTITYNPGTYGNETDLIKTVEVPSKQTITLEGALYTRDGYVQTGWSTAKSGTRKAADLGASYEVTRSRTLYPYWEAVDQVVTFDPGQFGSGNVQKFDVAFNKPLETPGAIFSRDGYSMIGWSTVDGATEYEVALGENTPNIKADVTYYPVWRLNVYGVETTDTSLGFGVSCVDYASVSSQKIVITNTGNVTLNYTIPAQTNYNIVVVAGSLELAEGNSLELSIQPIGGLSVGNYDEIITLACDNVSTSVSIDVKFKVVDHSFGRYVSDGNASYSEDGTKTAICLNGCGAVDTIADIGSKKVYSADNNDAVGLASSYIHHRTVRFTAYGSGMDDTEGVVGKRFVPVSWYVNDEFNGTFEEGYDVKFTHTVFGEYTLTINYVEEQLDEATGEWLPTGEVDEKVFEYTVGTTAEEEQEIVRPNTILSIIFGLFAKLFELLGL